MEKTLIDQTKVQQFEQKMVDILNLSSVSMMISIGHRTGLFDVMENLEYAASEEIARHAGLNERYVREWLGAMVTSGIVDYDSSSGTYRLPAEHAALLTRSASPNNLAVFTQYVAVLGSVEDQIVDAFEHGQGVPYSAYARFHEVMREDSGQTVVAALADHILPLVDGLQEKLERGVRAADVGCGSGLALLTLAKMFPNSEFTGYEMSEEAINWANAQAEMQGLRNAAFEVCDAAHLPKQNYFDWVMTFDAIHDQAQPDKVLENIYNTLVPGGIYLMQDIAASSKLENNLDHPLAPFIYTISCMHCMSVSLAGGGPGLGAAWGREKALAMLADAGFENARVEQLAHDIQNYYYIMQK